MQRVVVPHLVICKVYFVVLSYFLPCHAYTGFFSEPVFCGHVAEDAHTVCFSLFINDGSNQPLL